MPVHIKRKGEVQIGEPIRAVETAPGLALGLLAITLITDKATEEQREFLRAVADKRIICSPSR